MKKWLFTAMLATGALGNAWADSIEINDTFDDDAQWDVGQFWRVTDDAHMRGEADGGTFLLLKNQTVCNQLNIEIDVTALRAKNADWKLCGVAIYGDDKNFWAFTLVESPDKAGKKHYVELKEMMNGTWGAESNLGAPLVSKMSFDWQYNTVYRMKLGMAGGKVFGQLMDGQGKVVAEMAYPLTGDVVRCGRPALRVSGMIANFGNAKISGL